jgi:xanthine dehydrogenase YagR molybdenum-binding subunit
MTTVRGYAHSAIFAEVKVDEQLGVIRVTRIVQCGGGRGASEHQDRAQSGRGGGWGIGMALHEETLVDHKFGRIVNAYLAEYQCH